jgi:hypothetical protein
MAYITKLAKRTSLDYRFTVDSLDDTDLAALRATIKDRNTWIRRANKSPYLTKPIPELRVCIKNRGPRPTRYSHDTPRELATHFDVYIWERS